MNKGPVKSVLAKKITIRFLLVELALFLLVIILLFSLLLPALIRSATNKCDYVSTTIVNLFDNQLHTMSNMAYILADSTDLAAALREVSFASGIPEQETAQLNILLNDFVSLNNSCRRIVIDDMNGAVFSSITGKSEADFAIFSASSYGDIASGTKSTWISPIYTYVKGEDSLSYSFAYCKKFVINDTPYIISIYADITDVFTYINGISASFFDDIALFDIYGNSLYRSQNTDIFLNNPEFGDIYSRIHSTAPSSGDYFTLSSGKNHNCSLVGYTSQATLYEDFWFYFLAILLSFILVFLATIIILLPAISHSLTPLQQLYAAMNGITQGKSRTRVHIETRDEIGKLSTIYNSMLDTIDLHTAILLQKEREENRLRFSLVVSQIDPHFIFNTMNIITSLARQNKIDDIIKLNTALIKLLQDRLRITPTEVFDSIGHEISITREYISITQYRTQMDAVISFLCPEELLELQVPKNILQPLVENSLLHGLYDVNTGQISGRIDIAFSLENGYLLITVTDNGKGVSEEALSAFYAKDESPSGTARRGQHIGLRNVRDRLHYLYPEIDTVLSVHNITPHGTQVVIRIKIQEP